MDNRGLLGVMGELGWKSNWELGWEVPTEARHARRSGPEAPQAPPDVQFDAARMEGSAPVFERFTSEARRVLVLAQEEARVLNHDFIGTEHILLGLIHLC